MKPKERPILFSGPMVRALISGQKTQTRRIVKPQPLVYGEDSPCAKETFPEHCGKPWQPFGGVHFNRWLRRFEAGDKLWVKETCRAEELESGSDGVRYLADGHWREIENTEEASEAWGILYYYGADPNRHGMVVPSIHMPRWASRITLEIEAVRVERLQDISEEDAKCEAPPARDTHRYFGDYKQCFAQLWESIHGPNLYDANPWVWVIQFKKVKP